MNDERKYEFWGVVIILLISLFVCSKFGEEKSLPMVILFAAIVFGILGIIVFLMDIFKKR